MDIYLFLCFGYLWISEWISIRFAMRYHELIPLMLKHQLIVIGKRSSVTWCNPRSPAITWTAQVGLVLFPWNIKPGNQGFSHGKNWGFPPGTPGFSVKTWKQGYDGIIRTPGDPEI